MPRQARHDGCWQKLIRTEPFKITKSTLIVLLQALNGMCNATDSIDEIEFHMRMGATKEEALNMLQDVKKLLGQ